MEGGNEKVGDIKRILMEAFKKRVKFLHLEGGSNVPEKMGDQAECKKLNTFFYEGFSIISIKTFELTMNIDMTA